MSQLVSASWRNTFKYRRIMSSQEEGPQEPQQETLHTAAKIIQKAFRSHVIREVFKYFKELISHCNQQDPRAILKAVNPREAKLLDDAAGVFIRFRLGGTTYPPNIYYKIITHRSIIDLCASSPKEYTQPGLKMPVPRQTNNGWPLMQEDRSRRYQRMENNSWRLLCSKAVPISKPKEIEAKEKIDFHYSMLQRQQNLDKWQKKRKIEWLKQMYNQRCLQTATPVVNSAQEVMDAIEERGLDEIQDRELDELMALTNTVNFEEYFQEWSCLACSNSSEPGKGEHL